MINILVVDDDKSFITDVIAPLLPPDKYRVFMATTIEAARNHLHDRDFQYVIIDLRLTDNIDDDSGMILAAYIRAFQLAHHIIMATNHATLSRRAQAIRYLEVDAFIEKSDLQRDLLPLLKKINAQQDGIEVQRTSLTLSLSLGQPITYHSTGRIISSGATSTNLNLQIQDFVRWGEIARTSNSEDQPLIIKDIGKSLHDSIFSAPQIDEIMNRARGTGRDQVIVKLNMPAGMLGVPFEFLPNVTLDHPFSRFISGNEYIPRNYPISPPTMTTILKGHGSQLRILLIASDTYNPIPGVDLEVQELAGFFETKRKEGFPLSVDIYSTDEATYSIIQERMRCNEYDIIHYAGHSNHKIDKPMESGLFFHEGKQRAGKVEKLSVNALNGLLKSSSARLVFLNSCWSSAASAPENTISTDFLGLAHGIISAGIPTCIGYRWPIGDNHARLFATDFYSNLLETGDPTLAVWNARSNLRTAVQKPVWRSVILINQA